MLFRSHTFQKQLFKFSLLLVLAVLFHGCRTSCRNSATTWDYDNPKQGGFQKAPFVDQETPPDMVLIEGGAYSVTRSSGEKDSLIVPTFYISKYEETNGQYMAYLNFIKNYYSEVTYHQALPDTTVWNGIDADSKTREFLVKNYLREPIYATYPVVGLSPLQIEKYATWKTDRMNESILIREGVFSEDPPGDSALVFRTEPYYNGQYDEESLVKNIQSLNPDDSNRSEFSRRVRMEDGILMPRMRLLTINEWQFAHLAIGDSKYRYLKTPKPTRISKYHKDGAFSYLELQVKESRSEPDYLFDIKGLTKAFLARQNNYLVFGLNSNVSEIVGDSTSYVTIGGSFSIRLFDNSAIYLDNKTATFNYEIRLALHASRLLAASATGLYGFRLGMDRVGSPISEMKQTRFKGK